MHTEKLSILLIDDDKLVANSLARMLRGKRYDVSICPDPAQALMFCDKMQFDLIITDQRMPVMNGTEFAVLASQKQPQARVILISGYSDHDSVSAAMDHNVVHYYVPKPWDNQQLLAIVDEQIQIGQAEQLSVMGFEMAANC